MSLDTPAVEAQSEEEETAADSERIIILPVDELAVFVAGPRCPPVKALYSKVRRMSAAAVLSSVWLFEEQQD